MVFTYRSVAPDEVGVDPKWQVRAAFNRQGELVGYLAYGPTDTLTYVKHLYVDVDYRLRGIGRELVRWLTEEHPAITVFAPRKRKDGLAFWRAQKEFIEQAELNDEVIFGRYC